MAGFFNLPSARSTLKKDMNTAKKANKKMSTPPIKIAGMAILKDFESTI